MATNTGKTQAKVTIPDDQGESDPILPGNPYPPTPNGAEAGDIGPNAGAYSVLGTAGQTVEQATFRADAQQEGYLDPHPWSEIYYGVDENGNPVS
jgi:hypothetical protein